jgi:hypothetical protein
MRKDSPMDRDTFMTVPIANFMREHDLSSEDVMLILKNHVNDLQFEKELIELYTEGEEDLDNWMEEY